MKKFNLRGLPFSNWVNYLVCGFTVFSAQSLSAKPNKALPNYQLVIEECDPPEFTRPHVYVPPSESEKREVVIAAKKIDITGYKGAFNPSIVKYGDNYLLTFRYQPSRSTQYWISYTGVVVLNEEFEPISNPQLLDTRAHSDQTVSQSEDARLVSLNDKLYIVYNDNMETNNPGIGGRRDIYMAELSVANDRFVLAEPVKLAHDLKHEQIMCQKNWTPFAWKDCLLFVYSMHPHEILASDLKTGVSKTIYDTYTQKSNHWSLGQMRGGTPASLVDGEYLSIFHSGHLTTSAASGDVPMWHYYMGAYTFSVEPPFGMNKVSAVPIDHPSFYTYSSLSKRVIYPGGLIAAGPVLYVAYGKDDCEVWVATIDLEALKRTMIPVN